MARPSRRERDPHARRPPGRPEFGSSGHGASAAFSVGTIFIVFGALGMLVTSNGHAACSSVLVQAVSQGQCQEANAIWTLGILGVVVGIVLIITGAILRSRS